METEGSGMGGAVGSGCGQNELEAAKIRGGGHLCAENGEASGGEGAD